MAITHGMVRAAAGLLFVSTLGLAFACSSTPSAVPGVADITVPSGPSAAGQPIRSGSQPSGAVVSSAKAGPTSGCVTCHTSEETIDKLAARKEDAPKSAQAAGEG